MLSYATDQVGMLYKFFDTDVVGMGRFELPASCSQSRRANQAALHPGYVR